jgi:glycosyltransferase involved in cell wall biosynthesis
LNPNHESCRLSVVIASHNAKQVIATCLAALTSQLDPQHDEIIIADSSDDGTPEVVKAALPAGKFDRRFRVGR